eukprot:3078301-Pyramimonas_sp.AAC.1
MEYGIIQELIGRAGRSCNPSHGNVTSWPRGPRPQLLSTEGKMWVALEEFETAVLPLMNAVINGSNNAHVLSNANDLRMFVVDVDKVKLL